MKYALVTTTINIPHNLENYVRDIADHSLYDTLVVIAGDKKTPIEIKEFCERLAREYGISVNYLSPEYQENMDQKYSDFLRWNTIQRRNMAILYAYKQGAEIIVTIDDDNYLVDEDYLHSHGVIGMYQNTEVVTAECGWYNICERLQTQKPSYFYPRGYSFKYRGEDFHRIRSSIKSVRTVVNAGLWLGDPDIDAVTRLAIRPNVINAVTLPVVLDKGIYCPFNSQNTAIHRDVIPAYCMVSNVGRYDDIYASYIVKRIADHLGDSIRFGKPIVKQERNEHDLLADLTNEMEGMQNIDPFIDSLKATEIKGSTYEDCIKNFVAQQLGDPGSNWTSYQVACSYEAWLEALAK